MQSRLRAPRIALDPIETRDVRFANGRRLTRPRTKSRLTGVGVEGVCLKHKNAERNRMRSIIADPYREG